MQNIQEPFQGSLILNRQEAKSKLSRLTPNTEEYFKLQDALVRTAGIVEISLLNTTYKVDTGSENYMLLGGFGSSEHVAIGEKVKLKGLPEENTPLLVKGITKIRFGHIVALAGDFYGIAGAAISLPGGSDQDKTERFQNAFDTLAQADNDQLRRVVLEIDLECEAVKHSSLPHHCYSNDMIEKNKAIKNIKNDIDALLIDNSDHFSINAQDAYHIGHTLAMNVARNSGPQNDLEGLKLAYALDAFACHFLTDLFAAGHIRNQRGELESFLISQLGFSEKYAKPLAGILTGAQHEQDGNEGLNLYNEKGDYWRAYGDGSFFTPKNTENKEKAIAATQHSVDEIYNAYCNPNSLDPSTVGQLIPRATLFNPPPIYSVEEEGTSLFLHQGSNKIKIESQKDYLISGLSQAIRYLPQGYIDGVISLGIEMPPFVGKICIRQVQRLTGCVWQMIGLATFHQVKRENLELNAKLDEMADALTETYKNSLEILQQIQNVDSKLDDLRENLEWVTIFKEIRTPIETINDIAHQHDTYTLNPWQRQQGEDKLWDAHNRISRVFCKGTAAEGVKVLVAYGKKLATSTMSPLEIRVAVTLWFRQMLSYQVQAFSLYATLQVMKNDPENNKILQKQVLEFEINIEKQIEANKDYIDETLIFESQNYIVLQLEKSKTKKVALITLNNSK